MKTGKNIAVTISMLALVSLFLGCAHQASIPNTDKFPPHLKSVTSINKTQLVLSFDEELNDDALLPATFSITSTQDYVREDARIKLVYKDPTNQKSVILITSPLHTNGYQVSGLISDRKGNAANIKAKFKPSSRTDTIPPIATISPASSQITFPYRISFQFNEPVDTSKPISVITIPGIPADSLFPSWKKTFTLYQIECKDSTFMDRPFYVMLLSGAFDYNGNRSSIGASGLYYADTSLVLSRLFGSILSSGDLPAAGALVLLKSKGIVYAGTQSSEQGIWQIASLYKDSFIMECYYDSDQDGRFDEKASIALDETSKDSVKLQTIPLVSPLTINQILSVTE